MITTITIAKKLRNKCWKMVQLVKYLLCIQIFNTRGKKMDAMFTSIPVLAALER